MVRVCSWVKKNSECECLDNSWLQGECKSIIRSHVNDRKSSLIPSFENCSVITACKMIGRVVQDKSAVTIVVIKGIAAEDCRIVSWIVRAQRCAGADRLDRLL